MKLRKKIKGWAWAHWMTLASWLVPASFLISKPALAQPTTTIVRVDAIDGLNEPSPPKGNAWNNAFKYLSDALAHVASQGPDEDDEFEVWVASGVYRPDESANDPTGDDDRFKTFAMQECVRLYGGFQGLNNPGGGETSKNQRDPMNNVSTLSGDLFEDNVSNPPDPGEWDDNSLHIVTADGIGPSGVIDGFTIRWGFADGTSSVEAGAGGGMLIKGTGQPRILRCRFVVNWAARGGAVFTTSGQSLQTWFTNCHFLGNKAVTEDGGAVYAYDENICATPFTGFGSSAMFLNCVFTDNTAYDRGGALFAKQSATVTLVNCTMVANNADTGGALYQEECGTATTGGLTLNRCIIWANTLPAIDAETAAISATPTARTFPQLLSAPATTTKIQNS